MTPTKLQLSASKGPKPKSYERRSLILLGLVVVLAVVVSWVTKGTLSGETPAVRAEAVTETPPVEEPAAPPSESEPVSAIEGIM
jgi:hypothetical protein